VLVLAFINNLRLSALTWCNFRFLGSPGIYKRVVCLTLFTNISLGNL
jgi:hypothetical protein